MGRKSQRVVFIPPSPPLPRPCHAVPSATAHPHLCGLPQVGHFNRRELRDLMQAGNAPLQYFDCGAASRAGRASRTFKAHAEGSKRGRRGRGLAEGSRVEGETDGRRMGGKDIALECQLHAIKSADCRQQEKGREEVEKAKEETASRGGRGSEAEADGEGVGTWWVADTVHGQ
eukprot:365918-Chlamydomonas_euryale.AAC.4